MPCIETGIENSLTFSGLALPSNAIMKQYFTRGPYQSNSMDHELMPQSNARIREITARS
jgi:hypothetical protein